MEFLSNLGLFAAKTGLVALAVIVVSGFIFLLFNRGRARVQLEVEKLNDRYDALALAVQSRSLGKKAFKAATKRAKKKKKSAEPSAERVFVIDFDGDMRASAVTSLREEITAILSLEPDEHDEVVIRIESPGGLVSSYGLAAAQLERLRTRGVQVVACVDKVAASGGYMMACVANKIVAAPFAAVGSIGVLAGVPNVHRLLRRYDVDYREVTAGDWKRTVSVLGETTPEGLEKFKEKIHETHGLFKAHVAKWRPSLDIEAVANGDYWFGAPALAKGLVDLIQTSDDYLMAKSKTADILRVQYHGRKSFSDKLAENFTSTVARALDSAWTRARMSEFGL